MGVRHHTWDWYKKLIYECSNLECKNYSQLEVHHIIPIAAGGSDEFDNIIILCRDCHMHNNLHSDWMLYQDKLHLWKDKVDSHIMNELQQKQLIDSDCYYIENVNIVSEVYIKDENIANKDFLYENDSREELSPYQDSGIICKCWNCHRNKISFKFKNGLYCAECINKYTKSLFVDEFIFEPKIFSNLFKEYDPIKCEINRKERDRRMDELILNRDREYADNHQKEPNNGRTNRDRSRSASESQKESLG